MDQSREELERKAAKARQLARQVADKQAAESILQMAQELEEKAKQHAR